MKVKLLLLTFLSCTSFAAVLFGQNIATWEPDDAVETNFKITSEGADLGASEQLLLERGESSYELGTGLNGGYVHGYQSLHLEFRSEKRIVIKVQKDRNKRRPRLVMQFFDKNGDLLGSHEALYRQSVDEFTGKDVNTGPYFYSIDMVDIPMLLLQHTDRIELLHCKRNNEVSF